MTTFGSDLILARLRKLHPKRIDLSLGRIERLLEWLGHPERRLAPVVHIAGTNGKGSTLAMLDVALSAAGWRVQRYISPHLVHFNERILFDGVPIRESELADVLDIAERVNAGQPITEFEITTAAAFLAFGRRPADVLLLETGLGGRLDATNVIPRPLLTLMAPIALDHQSFLGDRLEQIALEKAGILKPGVLCIVGPQPPAALEVIEQRALEVEAPLLIHGRDWTVAPSAGRLMVTLKDRVLDLPLPVLSGSHQIDNAGLAVVAALHLDHFGLDERAIATGLTGAHWPARLQQLTSGKLVGLLPAGVELWLDGGHNPAAGAALAASLAGDPRPLHLIVGMLNTKDTAAFLRPLCRMTASLHAVPVPDEAASRSAEEIVQEASRFGLPSTARAGVADALQALGRSVAAPARVLICGSLYLAGHVLRENAFA